MAKTGRPNFDYTCQGYWRGQTHNFSITGNTTGAALSAADAKNFMEGGQSPYAVSFAPLQVPQGVNVIGSKYYDGVNSAPVYEATYDVGSAPAALTPTGVGFTTGTGATAPLEMCVMLEARCGTSSTGKPIFIRKFLRGGAIASTSQAGDNSPIWDFTAFADDAAKAMGNGSWMNSINYASPTGKTADSNGWSALIQIGNHQVPRGKKRKPITASQQQTLIQKLDQLLAPDKGF